LEIGGRGYVLKSDASRELVPAMTAVIEGRQFLSASLTDQSERRKSASVARQSAVHGVAFYSDNAALLEGYGNFAQDALRAGKALIVASGDILGREFEQEMTARGMDVPRLAREGRYRWFDVSRVLPSLLVDNWPDEKRFWEVVSPIVTQAAQASTSVPPRVAAWGECAPALWKTGNVEATIRLEQLWDELVRAYDVDIFCAYPAKGLSDGEDNLAFERICAVHSFVH
jgi:hypothetical protein